MMVRRGRAAGWSVLCCAGAALAPSPADAPEDTAAASTTPHSFRAIATPPASRFRYCTTDA
jgi:hypothetical protein